jgi:hypothetical protein
MYPLSDRDEFSSTYKQKILTDSEGLLQAKQAGLAYLLKACQAAGAAVLIYKNSDHEDGLPGSKGGFATLCASLLRECKKRRAF